MIEALRRHLFADNASEVLDLYLNGGRYSGAWFHTVGEAGGQAREGDRFSAADLVAVSTLGVRIPGWAAIEILERRADNLAELLARVDRRVELHEATDQHLAPVYALHDALDAIHDIGHVTRSKLIARKRPHLVPIRDEHVLVALLGRDHGDFTEPLRAALRENEDVRRRLDELRRGAGHPHLSLIRALDIIVWMRAHGLQSVS